MIGDPPRSNPTVQIPYSDFEYFEDPIADMHSPITHTNNPALANKDNVVQAEDDDSDDFDVPVDAYSCDNFRMFEFKVKRCARARSHDWTECPFAHPGEKARRRDPRMYHYSSFACPDFRNGACKKGDSCEYAHGVFECWLHPARYRTHPCKDGTHCRRRVCFFAHTPEQLRVLPDASPRGPSHGSFVVIGTSPRSTVYSPPSSPTTSSPPVSPGGSVPLIQLTESMRGLQINKMKLGLAMGKLDNLAEHLLKKCRIETVNLLNCKDNDEARRVMLVNMALKISGFPDGIRGIAVQEHYRNNKYCVLHDADFADGELKHKTSGSHFAVVANFGGRHIPDELLQRIGDSLPVDLRAQYQTVNSSWYRSFELTVAPERQSMMDSERRAAHRLVVDKQKKPARLVASLMHENETYFDAYARILESNTSIVPFHEAGRSLGDLRNNPDIGREGREYFARIYEKPFWRA